MQIVNSLEQLQDLAAYIKDKQAGYITNFFISQEKQNLYINDKLLSFYKKENTVIMLLELHDFYKLYYFSTDYNNLSADLGSVTLPSNIITCEILSKDSINNEEAVLTINGFKKYGKLINFYKRMTNINNPFIMPKYIRYADHNDSNAVIDLIFQSFNKYIDINMTVSEIKYYINNNVIVLDKDGEIIGFAIYTSANGQLYPMLASVKKEYRNTNFGTLLYITLDRLYKRSKFVSFFVREDNTYMLEYYNNNQYSKSGLYSVTYYKENGNDKIINL